MTLGVIVFLTFVAVSTSLPSTRDDGSPVVVVPQGTIVGIEESHPHADLYAFRSIPYALPPEDELRFMAPVPADSWDGELNATKIPPMCNQFIILGQEDCLYLNVYTPTSTSETEPLAVMVFLYGGAYYLGDTRLYDNTDRLVQHDVIVAMMNYRVGVLGFFSTDDSVAPGNQGLMDQTLALKWIKENIEYFGGDPNRITIFGESAGSSSVHYQILAPSAQGLFNRAIMESGTAMSPFATGRDFFRVSRELADKFCSRDPPNTSEEIVACLQKKLAFRIASSYGEFAEFNFQPFFFAPRIDGDYIPDQPARLLKEGRFSNVSILMGTNRDDGCLISGEMFALKGVLESLNSNFTTNAPITLELYDDEDPIHTANEVYQYYVGKTNLSDGDANAATRMFDDLFFGNPTDWTAIYHSRVADVYLYQLDHRANHGLADVYYNLGVTEAQNWICHTDELQYLFDVVPIAEPKPTDDILVGDMMTKMWTDFAKTGNPTPTDETIGFQWPKATETDLQHLSIQPAPSVQPDSRAIRRNFWESLPLRNNDIFNEL